MLADMRCDIDYNILKGRKYCSVPRLFMLAVVV